MLRELLSVWRREPGLSTRIWSTFLPALDAIIMSANSHLEGIDASLPRRSRPTE